MATANASEYLTLDGIPLSTAAWVTEDIATILDGPGTRGGDLINPARFGDIARRRTLSSRSATIPIVVIGHVDSDGNDNVDPRAGLIANLDELKTVLTPNWGTLTGTRTLAWVNEDTGETREAEVHIDPAISTSAIGPHAVRIVVTVTIPGGILRSDTASTATILVAAANTSATANVTIDGNVEVQDAVITVEGNTGTIDCATFKIENNTYGTAAGTDVYLEYDNAPDGNLVINADTYSATDDGSTVSGQIVTAGTPLWLPLLPGVNNITVTIGANTTGAEVTITYKAGWA